MASTWQLKLALRNANVKEDTPDTLTGRRMHEAEKSFASIKHLPVWISVIQREYSKESSVFNRVLMLKRRKTGKFFCLQQTNQES